MQDWLKYWFMLFVNFGVIYVLARALLALIVNPKTGHWTLLALASLIAAILLFPNPMRVCSTGVDLRTKMTFDRCNTETVPLLWMLVFARR